VKTTEGHQVYTPVIIASHLILEGTSFAFERKLAVKNHQAQMGMRQPRWLNANRELSAPMSLPP
jgi:hypothetical protein